MKRIVALLLAAACGGSRPDAAAGPSSDSLILERRIASDEASDHPFGHILGVLPVGDRLYLTQWGDQSVLAHDTVGRFIRRIGQEGAAPGEFRRVGWVGAVRDTIWVVDWALDRFTAFDTAGRLLAVHTATIRVPGWPRKGFPRGLTHAGLIAEGGAPVDGLASGRLPTVVPVVLAKRDGTAPRVVERLDRTRHAFAIVNADGSGIYGTQPFDESPVIIPDLYGRAFAVVLREVVDTGPTLSVVSRDAAADTLFARNLRLRRELLSDRVFDSATGAMLEHAPRADRSVFHRPSFLPASGEAFFAADGALWVQLGGKGVPDWAVLERDGGCRARLRLVLSGQVEAADGWRIWVVETDSLDVPSVVRYRVVPRVPADTGC